MSLPLAGRRIVVTRARQQAGQLSSALSDLGAEVIEMPLIEFIPPPSYTYLDEALRSISSYNWLIFTSANGVRVAAERLAIIGLPAPNFGNAQVVAIGPATAAAAQSNGFHVSVVPESYVAEGVVEALEGRVAGARLLLIRAKIARDLIPDALRSQGAVVDVVDAYETILPGDSLEMLPALLASRPDAITFTSSSTVRNFLALLRECHAETPSTLRAISIGPITSKSLREAGWEPFAEAAKSEIKGLVEATVHALRR